MCAPQHTSQLLAGALIGSQAASLDEYIPFLNAPSSLEAFLKLLYFASLPCCLSPKLYPFIPSGLASSANTPQIFASYHRVLSESSLD